MGNQLAEIEIQGFAAEAARAVETANIEAAESMTVFAAGKFPEYFQAKAERIVDSIQAEADAIIERITGDGTGSEPETGNSEPNSDGGGRDHRGIEGRGVARSPADAIET